MNHSTTTPTKAEGERIRRIVNLGCIVTLRRTHTFCPTEVHHIVEGNRRLGHWYSLPLSVWYHRGICYAGMSEREMIRLYGHSLVHGSKLFEQDHGTEKRLWLLVQRLLKLDRTWPRSKIVPRRCA